MAWDYGKLTAEVNLSGESRCFFHHQGSKELKKARDFIEAMNLVGKEGWECISVSDLRPIEDEEEFPGIQAIREGFFKRPSD